MNDAFFETLETVSFSSTMAGPKLLVFGSVHGNEVCGPPAIRKTIANVQNGSLTLEKGSVTFVPVCNPKAHVAGTRFVEKNLNRVICPRERPALYEERLANHLMRLIDACDWLLDIHSFHSEGPAFVFQDASNPQTESFVRCLGPDYIVTGWAEMYAEPGAANLMEGDTVGYAHAKGKTGAVIECGHHPDPSAVIVAETAILNAMRFLGLTESDGASVQKKPTVIRGTKVVIKNKPGKLAKAWRHFDSVRAGDVVALYGDGTAETASEDGLILLPKADAITGEEWFYYGVRDE